MFRYFELTHVIGLLEFVSVSLKSFFFRQYDLIYLFKYHCQTCFFFVLVPEYPKISLDFFPSLKSLLVILISLPNILIKFPFLILSFCSGSLEEYKFPRWLDSYLQILTRFEN